MKTITINTGDEFEITFGICDKCSCIIYDGEEHDKWHKGLGVPYWGQLDMIR